MPELKTIRHVQIMYNGRPDATLNTATIRGFTHPMPQNEYLAASPTARQTYDSSFVKPLRLIEAAIEQVPRMTEAAIRRLTRLIDSANAKTPVSAVRNVELNNTVLAFYKYFQVPADLRQRGADDAAWHTLRRIRTLYEATLAGLLKPYRLFLFESKNAPVAGVNALGFVTHDKVSDESHPLTIFFRTKPDENGHVPDPHWLATGDIHLHMDALRVKDADVASVSRLLLHEATHKWASTKDICYKWNSIAQKVKQTQWEKTVDGWKASNWTMNDSVKRGVQPAIDRGTAKPLLAVAKEGVAAGDWVYNADSYAYAAHRLASHLAEERGQIGSALKQKYRWNDR